ncbi:MAG: hypothetical protein PUP93_13380 [Rhizonema sp. NSF051]|nr:hypothetical protein [Rhizonema sp. NSF051]
MGAQREEISPTIANPRYRQQFDIEYMLRFGKQRLLMTEFQTPDVEHKSENWIRLVLLAYVQLWTIREERNTFTQTVRASQRTQRPVVKSNQNQHLIIKLLRKFFDHPRIRSSLNVL